MTQSPKISVVIPTCGRDELFFECVTSILNGYYTEFEILVIDQDSSQTLQQQLIERFPGEPRLRYFFLEKAGASRARNFGVQQAKGRIIAFIDDDAVADPEWLITIAETFLTVKPTPTLLAGRLDPLWPPDGRPDWYPKRHEYLLGIYNIGNELCQLPEHDQPIGANMSGLREVILDLGGFNEQLGPNYFRKHSMITGEEAVLGQLARKAGHHLYYQPKARVYHQISKTKLTRSYFLKRHFWEGVTVITEIYILNGSKLDREGHIRYHLVNIIKSLGRFCWPSFQNKYPPPYAPVRMLGLASAAQSLGVLYGLFTLITQGRK